MTDLAASSPGRRWGLAVREARERLVYDVPLVRALAGTAMFSTASALSRTFKADAAFHMMMRLHSSGLAPSFDASISRAIRDASVRGRQGTPNGLSSALEPFVDAAVAKFRASNNPDPRRLLGSRILVIKSHRPQQRGVLVVDYSYVFPLLAGLFDLRTITDRYFLVLEPSWRGVCAPEILLFGAVDAPVLVQTIEPRDHQMLSALDGQIAPIPIAANHWVDHRPVVAERQNSDRDIDVIMVAAWAAVKRHWNFFMALRKLRDRGKRLSVALVGYAYDKTKADIIEEARLAGVIDQIQFFENLPSKEVARLLGRSKIKVLWSRQECANRAIIEAMLANVPVIVRDGLTYGYKYPYINELTGRFVREEDLADSMLRMIDERESYSPRDWVTENMTPPHAAEKLQRSVELLARDVGESWSESLTLKFSSLHSQEYWNPEDANKFRQDYGFLESMIRR